MISDYFQQIKAIIHRSPVVSHANITYDQRDEAIGFLRGSLYLYDDSVLHISEYVNTEPQITRLKYRYHWQNAHGALIFRYDNAPHYPHLPNAPHHKHNGEEDNVISASPPDIFSVLIEIQNRLLP